jgi:hypothetical protein
MARAPFAPLPSHAVSLPPFRLGAGGKVDKRHPKIIRKVKPYSSIKCTQKTERLNDLRLVAAQMGSYAGQCDGEPNGKHRDAMMVDLTRMSLWPRPNETFDLMGKGFIPGLFIIPQFVKEVRKTIKNLDWLHPLFGALRVAAGNVTQRACRALNPFTDRLACDKTRRKYQNKAVNEILRLRQDARGRRLA